MCNVSLNKLRKLDKEELAGLKNYLQEMKVIFK